MVFTRVYSSSVRSSTRSGRWSSARSSARSLVRSHSNRNFILPVAVARDIKRTFSEMKRHNSFLQAKLFELNEAHNKMGNYFMYQSEKLNALVDSVQNYCAQLNPLISSFSVSSENYSDSNSKCANFLQLLNTLTTELTEIESFHHVLDKITVENEISNKYSTPYHSIEEFDACDDESKLKEIITKNTTYSVYQNIPTNSVLMNNYIENCQNESRLTLSSYNESSGGEYDILRNNDESISESQLIMENTVSTIDHSQLLLLSDIKSYSSLEVTPAETIISVDEISILNEKQLPQFPGTGNAFTQVQNFYQSCHEKNKTKTSPSAIPDSKNEHVSLIQSEALQYSSCLDDIEYTLRSDTEEKSILHTKDLIFSCDGSDTSAGSIYATVIRHPKNGRKNKIALGKDFRKQNAVISNSPQSTTKKEEVPASCVKDFMEKNGNEDLSDKTDIPPSNQNLAETLNYALKLVKQQMTVIHNLESVQQQNKNDDLPSLESQIQNICPKRNSWTETLARTLPTGSDSREVTGFTKFSTIDRSRINRIKETENSLLVNECRSCDISQVLEVADSTDTQEKSSTSLDSETIVNLVKESLHSKIRSKEKKNVFVRAGRWVRKAFKPNGY